MDAAYTIVLPDADLLSRVCGTNDSNLKLIEEHLGVPVFTRGNELSVDKDDPQVQQQFRFIIDRILDEIAESGESSTDMVASILNTGLSAGRWSPDDYAITVPGGIRKVYPKTPNQIELVQAFRTSDMVFSTGPAGCGKTFLAVAEALRLVLSHRVHSIVLTRPVVEAGESLGYLPGDLEDKISPYLRPLYDAMGTILPREMVHKLMENNIIEIAPLAYMRGRTLNDSVVILDEAQNTTKEQMKMFLTRMGERSKMFITGDLSQTDLPRHTESGLGHAVKVLNGIPEISMVVMNQMDVVRAPLVRKIVQAYENEHEQNIC